MPSKPLGEILVELGYTTRERIPESDESGEVSAQAIGERLCRLGIVRHEDVIHARAVQHGIPCVEVMTSTVSPDAVQCLPPELAQRYQVLPLVLQNGCLEVAMADPFDLQAVEDLAVVCGRQILRRYARPNQIADALRRYYGTSAARMADSLGIHPASADEGHNADSVGNLQELAREPSLINLVNLIILEAINDSASDIHIEPFEKQLKVKYRIDGVLHEMSPPPKHLQPAIISRIKIMAQLNIAERFIPQDGHIKFSGAGANVDIRVSTVPTMFGESVVMRILDKSNTLRNLDQLGMGPQILASFENVIRSPHGIVLVTGPTGSGKTTTLYAALNHMYTPEKKILTIEDPAEFHLEGVNQIQVNVKRGLTFASGLRSMLRQDPDIIMVGEIRDGETADIAIRSALTGHLVFSSLHTNDAASAITRLLDMNIEPYLLATSIEAVVAQRLVRILCSRCREPYTPSAQVVGQLGADAIHFNDMPMYHGKGCQECHGTGYRGRLGIFEMIRMNDAIRDMIMTRPSSAQVRRAAGSNFTSMRHDGYKKVLAGVTALEEVWRVTMDTQQDAISVVDSDV